MTRLSEGEVRRIAGLARLELDEEEIRRLADELGDLLEEMERLRDLPTPPLEAGEDEPALRLRPDAPPSEPLAREPGSFAPDWREGFFVLPRLEAVGEGTGPDEPAR